MIDIGVNLTSSQFDQDWREVVEQALQHGVATLIITGTSVEESRHALTQAKALNLYSTAGVHPHNASGWTEASAESITALLQERHVVAVGECGLDYNRNFSTPEQQRNAFNAQLHIATQVSKPLFLHCRDAHDDFIAMLKPIWSDVAGGVLHCFTGSDAELDACLDLGLHIGVTGWLCDERRGQLLQQQVKRIPLDKLLIETDAPYLLPRDLSPKPSSRRNEPKFLAHIANTVASLIGMPVEKLIAQTEANTRRLFAIP